MCQGDGIGHILGGLVGGVTKHHALVASAGVQVIGQIASLGLESLVHTHGNISTLLIQCHHDSTGVAVEALGAVVVADLYHGIADDGGNVQLRLGGNLACDKHVASTGYGLAGHAAHGVLSHAGVEDRIGHRIAKLIGMSLCY